MSAPYIPTSDAAFDAWSQNFNTRITANPTLYGLAPADAVAIDTMVAAYHAEYLIAGVSGTPPKTPLSPSTRTPVTIAQKDSAKAAALPIVRFYAINIRNNQGVSNSDKTDLGLTIVKTTPTPIPAPVTVPVLVFVAATPGSVTFSRRDSGTPSIKAMPAGAVNAQIFIAYANQLKTPPEVLPDAPTLAEYDSIQTKGPFQISLDTSKAGYAARIWARWQTRRGLVGDFGVPLDFIVPAGGM